MWGPGLQADPLWKDVLSFYLSLGSRCPWDTWTCSAAFIIRGVSLALGHAPEGPDDHPGQRGPFLGLQAAGTSG